MLVDKKKNMSFKCAFHVILKLKMTLNFTLIHYNVNEDFLNDRESHRFDSKTAKAISVSCGMRDRLRPDCAPNKLLIAFCSLPATLCTSSLTLRCRLTEKKCQIATVLNDTSAIIFILEEKQYLRNQKQQYMVITGL